MNHNLNVNEIGGVALADLVKTSFSSLTGVTVRKMQALYVRIFEDFSPYMEQCYKRNRFVRIICQGDADVDLLEIYVPSFFKHGGKRNIPDAELTYRINEGGNFVITGKGGAGKTFFMRKLWLDMFQSNEKTPIFLELRKLNDVSFTSVETFIRASISSDLPESLFEKFCQEGKFIFILDGFDELPEAELEKIQSQIINISEKFPNCGVVVSSRPHERFNGWSNFLVYESSDLTLEQTRQLCTNIPFDEDYRKLFLKKLTKDFHKSYEGFLTNPLLTIMMMMTFKDNMDIPKKMGIFYDAAFVTLYQRHDTVKVFNRQKHLDIQQFRRSFGAFCLMTYVKEKYSFSRTELLDFISKSSKLSGAIIPAELVVDDYERNVNLIKQDGMKYYFIHRSFQEYFSAWALSNLASDKFEELVKKFHARFFDQTLLMCYDLDRPLVVNKYIKPYYENKKFNLSRKFTPDTAWRVIGGFTTHIIFPDQATSSEKYGYTSAPELGLDFVQFILHTNSMRQGANEARYSNYSKLSKIITPPTLEDLIPRWVTAYENKTRDFLSVLPNMETNTLIINNEDGHEIVIPMSDREIEVFSKISKELVNFLSSLSKWCRDEIEFVEESSKCIDDLFLD